MHCDLPCRLCSLLTLLFAPCVRFYQANAQESDSLLRTPDPESQNEQEYYYHATDMSTEEVSALSPRFAARMVLPGADAVALCKMNRCQQQTTTRMFCFSGPNSSHSIASLMARPEDDMLADACACHLCISSRVWPWLKW